MKKWRLLIPFWIAGAVLWGAVFFLPASETARSGKSEIEFNEQDVSATETADDSADTCIHINHAAPEELEKLPGIGPVLARRITAFRDSAGPFQNGAELEAVKGIGIKKRSVLQEYLCF